jgi:prolyl-tRNA editing enzyme YbaK/EbsC (Cys-tRNA(Pro) deacylase)
MMTYADDSLTRDTEIAFNAGTHHELIRMSWEDYALLAEPRVQRIAVGPRAEAA